MNISQPFFYTAKIKAVQPYFVQLKFILPVPSAVEGSLSKESVVKQNFQSSLRISSLLIVAIASHVWLTHSTPLRVETLAEGLKTQNSKLKTAVQPPPQMAWFMIIQIYHKTTSPLKAKKSQLKTKNSKLKPTGEATQIPQTKTCPERSRMDSQL